MTSPSDRETKYRHWKRATQITGEFPKDKYGFSTHLVDKGDMIETFPMSWKDFQRFENAVYQWAWRHDKRVRTERVWHSNDTLGMRVTLVAHHRVRDYS